MLIKPYIISLFILSYSPISMAMTDEHTHDSAHKEQSKVIQLNHGKKWEIDSSLHIGMTNIKISFEKNISPIHYKKFTNEQYNALAKEIDKQLTYLFENCKLPKNADEQLHTLLFSIIQGNNKMKSAENPRTGAIEIIKTLQQYPQYFDDKNWQSLKH